MSKTQTILYFSGDEESEDEVEQIQDEICVEPEKIENEPCENKMDRPITDTKIEEPKKSSKTIRGSYQTKYICKHCKRHYVKIDKFTEHETKLCPILKQKKEKEAEMILKENERILSKAKRTEYLKQKKEERDAKRPVVEKVVEKVVQKPVVEEKPTRLACETGFAKDNRGRKLLPKVVEKVVEVPAPTQPAPPPAPKPKPAVILKFC